MAVACASAALHGTIPVGIAKLGLPASDRVLLPVGGGPPGPVCLAMKVA